MNDKNIKSKKKSVLYISRAFTNNSPVGLRFKNFQQYLNVNYSLTTINLSNTIRIYNRRNQITKIAYKIFKHLPILPDSDRLVLRYYKKEIRKAVKNKEFDYVLVQVLPFSFLLLAKFIREIAPQTKVVFDFSDPISKNVKFNSYPRSKQKYLQKLEKNSLLFVDHLIVLNEEIREFYASFFDSKNKVSVIQQGYSKLDSKTDLSEFSSSKCQLKLIYAGAFYKEMREPFELYRAINDFDYNLYLSVFGKFKAIFRPPVNSKFYYGGSVSQMLLFEKYHESDVIVFIDNKNSLQIPGKLLEVLSTGKTILCITHNLASPSVIFLKKSEGVFCTENRKEAIQEAIWSIINTNKYYWDRNLEEYSWFTLLSKLNQIMF